MTLAPFRLGEAAGSLAKASTPEPWSTSRTSNWVARAGGLPDYIQHISHGIFRSQKVKDESKAIQMAIGVCKNPPASWGAEAKAACAKAIAEWEAKKAGSRVKESVRPTLAVERAVQDAALLEVAMLERHLGADGLVALLAEGALLEAAAWSPTLKRTASASDEIDRHEVYDGGQHVGTVARRRGMERGERHAAFAVNGQRVTDYSCASRPDALKALQAHLEEAPARVIALPTAGKFLVAKPSSYSGETSYQQFSTEAAARHMAGLPPQPTVPERNSKVEAVAEVLRWDLELVDHLDVRPLRRVQEARRRDPFGLVAEAFDASELRDFRGRWEGHGGAHPSIHGIARLITPAGASPKLRRSAATHRYEGGVGRLSQETRGRLSRMFSAREAGTGGVKHYQPHQDLKRLYALGPGHQKTFEGILGGVAKSLGAQQHSTASADAFRRAQGAVSGATDGRHVIVAALKGRKRAEEKIDGKYDGDASRLTDLVRGTVLVGHANDIPTAIEHLRRALPAGWEIRQPQNRFHFERDSKVHTGQLGSGYRDVSLLLKAPDGFLAEVQVNTTHMWVAKEVAGGHALYERSRTIAEAAKRRQLTSRERLEYQRLEAKGRELYAPAMVRSTRAVRLPARQ